MEQLTQNLKDGKMQLLEVPYPALLQGNILVRTHFSLISTGTEGKTVKDARLGYLGKARARKDEVKKVLDAARTFGWMSTYKMVMNKLDAPSALGYSCSGEVIAVASDVTDFKIGDKVACGGNSAVHAEVVAVPVNLCVKVTDDIDLKHAAFTTLGAIALQGVRQADLRLGENAVVIGLGLVGQLTMQLLKASGVKAIGIDVNQQMVDVATGAAHLAFNRQKEDLEYLIKEQTGGYGADAVIITAGTDSHDPIDLAGALCRKKGKVVVVGAVPTGFKRTNYFKKELDLRMSCSYGPGRYDNEYEEQGIDYPYAYVRWTENRNMQAFVDLLSLGKINMDPLITHNFDFINAPAAYDLVINKTEPYIGMLLKYDVTKQLSQKVIFQDRSIKEQGVCVGLIGAGSFAQNFLLPALNKEADMVGVVTARANNARNIADKYLFEFASTNSDDIFTNHKINTVFIATRHDSHAKFVLEALRAGKNVFVEKPLCLTEDELHTIANEYVKAGAHLMVGFNRRFAPFIEKAKRAFSESTPLAINIRVNAGAAPADSWIQNPQMGGGRIIGEVCHFVNLASYLANSPVKSVSAISLNETQALNDTLTVNLKFSNGSIAQIGYFSNGNKSVNKEQIEVFGGGLVVRINDFRELIISGKSERKISASQDKGHPAEIKAFCDAIKNGKATPISFDEIYNTTLATFKVVESIKSNGSLILL
jgi:polar amino acid transport system substrate-binding protein